jgi:peptide/nickel transport system ATP-binding protein/oligopeptide transport system ATP-binding protein
MPEGAAPLLDVRDLSTVFRTGAGEVHAVNSVSFAVRSGEVLGVVGESGAGKSVAMMSLIGLLDRPPAEVRGGRALFEGADLLAMPDAALRRIRGARIGVVFQDPMTSLNPVLSIGYQIAEPLRKHLGLGRAAARARAADLLSLVQLPQHRLDDYPHQLSGGMRQRVMLAIALACEPVLLIADEPTTSLDVTIQAQIIALMKELRTRLDMAIVWVTHDLGVLAGLAGRVVVMYGGQIVEQAPVRDIFASPQHPYTRALLAAAPSLRAPRPGTLRAIPGQPPILTEAPRACPFRPRCPHAMPVCAARNPPRFAAGPGRDVACFWDARSGGRRDV